MKIQHLALFVLWSAKLAASQSTDVPLPTDISQYPTCVQNAQCLEYAASTYCTLDPYIGCACDRQVVGFFVFLYYCAIYASCSTADVSKAVDLGAEECKGNGYDVTSKLQEALATPTFSLTFSVPSVTIPGLPNPTFTFPSNTIQSNNPSVTSDPSVTSNPDTTLDPTNTATTSKGSGSSGLTTGVVGGVAVIAIIAGLIVFCMRHKAKQRRVQAMTAPPPPPPPGPTGPPPPMAQYTSPLPPPPQGYSPYPAPVYPPQQQPVMQQQQQPLMQGYQELEQLENGYYASPKIDAEVMQSIPPTTTTTPAPLPQNQQGQYFQELPAQQVPVQVGPSLAQQGHVYVEMPGDNGR